MPPHLGSRRCIVFRESPAKKPFAVVIAVKGEFALIARGTGEGEHDAARIIPDPIAPGTPAANRWRSPTITIDTFFYKFDIQPVRVAQCDLSGGHGLCEDALWDAIKEASQEKLQQFEAGTLKPRPKRETRRGE